MAQHQVFFSNIVTERARKRVFRAMDNEDLAEVVLAALHIIKTFPLDQPPMKSDQHQTLAEAKFFKEKNDNRNALVAFNKAICQSHKNSNQQLRAYVARTCLLSKIRDIEGCLLGIEICKSMNLNYTFASVIEDIATNCAIYLHLRPRIIKQRNLLESRYFYFFEWLFRTAQCAIAQVHVSAELGIPVIKARSAILVGTLVALEKPFVSLVDSKERYTSCHHCHLMSNNLIPCDECCYVMYCGDKCKRIAMEQYHRIECKVSDLLEDLTFDATERLMIKAVIKMKLMATWWDFIQDAEKLCGDQNGRLLFTEINEIFNRNSKFSLLKCRPGKIFIQGKVYNASFKVAAIIKRLAREGFFPLDARRELAIRSFARVMMHLVVFPPRTVNIPNCEEKSNPFSNGLRQNAGWFSFTSRLQHSCDPNLLHIGIGNQIALVSLRNIPKGSDLTISYLGHFYDSQLHSKTRASRLITHLETWCHCRVCSDNLDPTEKVGVLTTEEKACYEEWRKTVESSTVSKKTDKGVTVLNYGAAFIACRKAMAGLQYATGSGLHRDVFRFFCYLLKKSQIEAIQSFTIEEDTEDIVERLSF